MKSISPKAHFRQLVIKYSQKRGVTAASIRYRVCRKAIYDWKKRYDGRWQSLIDRSHRPHSHPRQQTAEEYAMIERYYRKTKDKIMLWDKLREKGYTRCYNSLLRAIKRLKLEETPDKRKGYKPKPYQRAEYPGQKVQIDVKFVPSYCVSNGLKYYQYTAVDECSRWVYREMYKVERQHRIDEQRFYKKMKMYNLDDGRQQLAKYNKKSNNIPKICLGFLTPNEVLEKYLGVM